MTESIQSGQRLGQLTVIGLIRHRSWVCECDCGQIKIIRQSRLVVSRSCGCAPGQRPNTIANIMARLIVMPNGCCIWPGSKAGGAKHEGLYGVVSYQGKQRYVHDLLYTFFVGPVPSGMVLDHAHCDRPDCANWTHLRACPQAQNVLRGRSLPAINARKTHCKRGHELTAENVLLNQRGNRQCRACRREQDCNRPARQKPHLTLSNNQGRVAGSAA